MKTALVIGGGIAGCAATPQLMKLGGWDVTIVEAAPFLGAGVRTFWYGGHPYTFGPRQFITYVEPDNAFYNYPIHEDDIALMPDRAKIAAERQSARGVAEAKNLEEYWVGSVGQTLYDKLI